MSISCVCRSVWTRISCTGTYPTEPVANETLTSPELDAFRDQVDRFVAELDEEAYLHYAGHKETYEVEQIYERHEELTRLETAKRLEGAPTELWRFACEGYLGNLTREHQEKIAAVEAELEATVDGETIPFRMLRVALSNEPDRDKRQRLEQTRVRLVDEHLNPVYLDAARVLRADRGPAEGDARHPADRRPRRLGGALPRGRPHRALRAHRSRPADGGAASR